MNFTTYILKIKILIKMYTKLPVFLLNSHVGTELQKIINQNRTVFLGAVSHIMIK